MSYYSSAEEMAGDLSLGVLLQADPDPRVLRRHDRLSGYAADPAHGARLYNLVKSAMVRQGADAGLAGKVLWIAAPRSSLHHLPWVIGLAEHAARDGLAALLDDRDETGPLGMLAEEGGRPVDGLTLPGQVSAGPVQACSTDMEGVSVVLRGSGEVDSQPLRLESDPWCLLRADALPESMEGPYPEAGGTDGVILVAPFRDHSREELTAIVRGLRSAGHRIFGLVAIGPRSQGVPDAMEPQEPVSAVSAETGDPAPVDVSGGLSPVPLITTWDRRTRGRRSRWPAAVLITTLVLAVPVALFLRDHLSPPSHPDGDAEESARPAPAAWGEDPWSSQPRPIASEIGGEDVLGPPGHDDTAWDLLGSMDPMEAPGPGEVDSAFGVAHPVGVDDEENDSHHEGRGYVVHLSSFRHRSEADREISNMAGLGIDARHIAVVIPGRGLSPWYRVVTGLFAGFAEAESLALYLISEGKVPGAHVAGRDGHGDPVPVATPD